MSYALLGRASLALLLSAGALSACFSDFPKFTIYPIYVDDRFIRIDNRSEVAEIRHAESFDLLWEAPLENFRHGRSELMLSYDGTALYHVRSGLQLEQLDEVCVEVHTQDGSREFYHLDEILEALFAERGSAPGEGDPWLKETDRANAKSVALRLFDDTLVYLYSDVHQMEFSHPDDAATDDGVNPFAPDPFAVFGSP